MNVLNLNNGIKIEILSKDNNYFNEEVFTKYSILKYEDDIFLLYKSKYITGDEIFSLNKIKSIYSEIVEEDIIINFNNEIKLGCSVLGYIENGLRFNINNVISIKQKIIEEKERLYLKERL